MLKAGPHPAICCVAFVPFRIQHCWLCDNLLLNRSGLGALELYSMALKATGSYVSRTLSYSGAEFNLVNVKIDPVFR